MNRELVNREQRLRYKARKKGLYIKKGKWYQYYDTYRYESHTGYCCICQPKIRSTAH